MRGEGGGREGGGGVKTVFASLTSKNILFRSCWNFFSCFFLSYFVAANTELYREYKHMLP